MQNPGFGIDGLPNRRSRKKMDVHLDSNVYKGRIQA
ncbi:unnamed protein product, partial [marine sediment metagenome]